MKNKTAFSLIELLVALSILAIVAAVIIPRFLIVNDQAVAQSNSAQVVALQSAAQKWIDLGGTYSASYDYMTTACMFSSFLSQSPTVDANGNYTRPSVTANNVDTKCTDSIGPGGSGNVTMAIILKGSPPPPNTGTEPGCFYRTGGTPPSYYFYYRDTTGVLWRVAASKGGRFIFMRNSYVAGKINYFFGDGTSYTSVNYTNYLNDQ